MSDVVLRCPNCGTTKATSGECEACHEAQVRYYCTNHTPGRWLEGSTCSQCGAKFGDPPRRVLERPVTPVPMAARAPSPPGRTRVRTSWRPSGGGPWRKRSPLPDRELEAREERERDALAAILPELLRRTARARRAPTGEMHLPESPSIAPILGGCLRSALLLALFLLLALALLGGSLIQFFGVYY